MNSAIKIRARSRVLTHVCALLLCLSSSTALSAGLERLLMPGRVIAGHADIESECGACHDAESDQASTALCAGCHEDVSADRSSKDGFHGRFPGAQGNECITCHTDHEGRDADITAIDSGLFDHRWTDFILAGAHRSADCADCHVPNQTFRDAPGTCYGCHAEDDSHAGGLGQQCDSCHSDSNWQQTEFDHDLTDYRLTGNHSLVACGDCHRDNLFSKTPTRCASCHAVDDVHSGANGSACQDCHSTSSWRGVRFDHAETDFPLENAHAGLQCNDCHSRQDFKDMFEDGCVDCHRSEDEHQGRNGQQCDDCHRPLLWSDTTFDHDSTGFSLVDAHTELNCTACHKASTMGSVPNSCGSCHTVDDSHAGQFADDCLQCHSQQTWRQMTRFDHDLTTFPLIGLHATVACGACHSSNRFREAKSGCADCHGDNDVHEGALGNACGTCHNSNDWLMTTFDHDLHTRFSLDGSHARLNCVDCHSEAAKSAADVASSCGGCHVMNDAHEGQFGLQCEQCHSTTSFRDVESLGGRKP